MPRRAGAPRLEEALPPKRACIAVDGGPVQSEPRTTHAPRPASSSPFAKMSDTERTLLAFGMLLYVAPFVLTWGCIFLYVAANVIAALVIAAAWLVQLALG